MMNAVVTRLRQKAKTIKDKWKKIYMRHRYVSGITVIELVLILVRNLPPYFEGVLCV